MPSFQEELERMLWLKREGKVSLDERVKVIFPRLEAKKRVKNVEGRTRAGRSARYTADIQRLLGPVCSFQRAVRESPSSVFGNALNPSRSDR